MLGFSNPRDLRLCGGMMDAGMICVHCQQLLLVRQAIEQCGRCGRFGDS